eukprot:symbB.v1.2.011704.t1/scaffold787.1/size162597/15
MRSTGASLQAKARAGRKAASTPAAAKPKASPPSLEPKTEAMSEESVWNALVEVLTLSAHILTEDASQLPFQVLGRFLAQESQRGPVAAICAGATAALEAWHFWSKMKVSFKASI